MDCSSAWSACAPSRRPWPISSIHSRATPREIVTCKVDLAMVHDSSGARRLKPMLERLGAKVWDPGKIVVITDHYVPEHDDDSRQILRITRDWVREVGIDNFYDAQGIC